MKPDNDPLRGYPQIRDLWKKAEKRRSYEAAAKALEGIDDDEALALLEKVKLSPFEEEVISYVRTHFPR